MYVPLCGYWVKIGLISFRQSRWHFYVSWMIEISIGAFKVAMNVYISYTFGGLLFSTSGVNAAQLCTAGISRHLG